MSEENTGPEKKISRTCNQSHMPPDPHDCWKMNIPFGFFTLQM
jgi:hypothetical protein